MSTKDKFAETLAQSHFEIEPGLARIVRLTCDANLESSLTEPVKLLEVNENTIPTGVMPLHFGPDPAAGLTYPTVIVEVTPDEYEDIASDPGKLPNGWRLGSEIPRRVASVTVAP